MAVKFDDNVGGGAKNTKRVVKYTAPKAAKVNAAAAGRYNAQAVQFANRANNAYAGRYQVQANQAAADARAMQQFGYNPPATQASQYYKQLFTQRTAENRANQAYAQRLQRGTWDNVQFPGRAQLSPYVNERANHYRYDWVTGYDPIRANQAYSDRLNREAVYTPTIPTEPTTTPVQVGGGVGGYPDYYGGGGYTTPTERPPEWYMMLGSWRI